MKIMEKKLLIHLSIFLIQN